MTINGDHIAVDQPTAQQTYNSTQDALRDHRDAIPTPNDTGIHDPTISKALRDHNGKTKDNIDATHDSLDTGKDAARDLADTDADSAGRTKRGDEPGGVSALRDALAKPAGPANPFAAAPMMPAPAPPPPAPVMPTPPMPQMPMPMAPQPGVVNLAPQALAKLIADAQPAAHMESAAARAPGGIQPLHDSQIAFRPTGETLNRGQINALIDRALDNNGVSTSPQVRALWHEILSNQWFHESSFAPDAVNRDACNTGAERSDGAAGDAARGLAQVKPGTFAAHHVGGTSNNIYDPEANASAGVAYMMAQYHVSADGTGLEAFHASRSAANYGAY